MDNKIGIDNSGSVVVKNRRFRRRRLNSAQLDGKPRNFYTTPQTKKRTRHGKTVKISKKSC